MQFSHRMRGLSGWEDNALPRALANIGCSFISFLMGFIAEPSFIRSPNKDMRLWTRNWAECMKREFFYVSTIRELTYEFISQER